MRYGDKCTSNTPQSNDVDTPPSNDVDTPPLNDADTSTIEVDPEVVCMNPKSLSEDLSASE